MYANELFVCKTCKQLYIDLLNKYCTINVVQYLFYFYFFFYTNFDTLLGDLSFYKIKYIYNYLEGRFQCIAISALMVTL